MTKGLIFALALNLSAIVMPGLIRSQELIPHTETTVWQEAEPQFKPATPANHGLVALRTLSHIENLIIDEFPGGAILSGNLLSPKDMRQVILLSGSLDNVFNLCSFHPEALVVAASYIQEILRHNRINGLNLSPLGDALLMTGTPAEEGDTSRVQRICSSLNIPLIDGTRSKIADSRMVFFEVTFIEVNKDIFNEIGIKWPVSSSFSDPSGMRIGRMEQGNALEITIDHQVHKGNARIISKPRLVCASGQKASFQAGGEIPIPRSDSEGNISVTWKPYGIILQVSPTIDSKNNIHVQIRSEVSMVDHANAIDGVPGILTRKVETYLSLATGQTVVLSGLVHSDDAKNIQKIPVLGDIPILGELFTSRSFQKRETELVVFLKPLPTADDPHNEDEPWPILSVGMSGSDPGTK